jgi:sodium transport system permease protein
MSGPVVWTIYAKELRETLRDRRALYAMVLLPIVLYPVLILLFSQLEVRRLQRLQSGPVRVAVAPQGTPDLFLSRARSAQGVRIVVTLSPREAMARDRADVWVSFPPDFGASLRAGRPAPVTVHFDATKDRSREGSRRMEDLLDRWGAELVRQRLAGRGLSPSLVMPLRPEYARLDTPRERSAAFLGILLPFLLIVMSTLGAFYPAIDLTAGEKERGTLETLLVCPASRREIIAGKYLVVCTLALATSLLNLGSMTLTAAHGLGLSGSGAALGLLPSAAQMLGVLGVLLPLVALFSALMIAMASFARTYKEAQSYLTPIYTLVMLPAMVTLLPGIQLTPRTALAPVAGPALLTKALLMGTATWPLGLVVVAASIAYAAAAVALAARLFEREDILLGEGDSLTWKGWLAAMRRGRQPVPEAGQVLGFFLFEFLLLYYAGSLLQQRSLWSGLVWSEVGLVLLPTLLFVRFGRFDAVRTLRLRAPSLRAAVGALCLALGGLVVVTTALVIQNRIMPVPTELTRILHELTLGRGAGGLAGTLLMVAVLPGICEETLFRGVILTGLRRRWRAAPAVVVTALLFGLFHMSVYRLVPAMLLGILLGYIAVRSGSLFPAILAHVASNSAVVLLGRYQLLPEREMLSGETLPAPLLLAGVALAIFGVWALAGVRGKSDLPGSK